jgi:hypothetical protein
MKRYEIRSNEQARTVGIFRRCDGMPVIVRNYHWLYARDARHKLTVELTEIMDVLEQEVENVLSKTTTTN